MKLLSCHDDNCLKETGNYWPRKWFLQFVYYIWNKCLFSAVVLSIVRLAATQLGAEYFTEFKWKELRMTVSYKHLKKTKWVDEFQTLTISFHLVALHKFKNSYNFELPSFKQWLITYEKLFRLVYDNDT